MPDSLYRTIYETLKAEIDARALLPGDRIPTELELCRRFGVSRITARHAVQKLEELDLVYRVKGKGTFVKVPDRWEEFFPFKAAEGTARLISAILPHQAGSSFELLRGMEDECKRRGFYISFHNSGGDCAHEREIVRDLVESGHTRGLVIYPVSSHCNLAVYSRLVIQRFPLVFVDRDVDGIRVPVVKAENTSGSREAVSYLAHIGHRRIGFAASDLYGLKPVQERYLGYCTALVEAGIELNEAYVYNYASFAPASPAGIRGRNTAAPGRDLPSISSELVERIRKQSDPPTALLFENDYLAVDFLREALPAGLAVPRDISVVGFDNLAIAEHLSVPLTTVEQSFFQIGVLSVRKLIAVMSGEETRATPFEVATKLIVRNSTCPPRLA